MFQLAFKRAGNQMSRSFPSSTGRGTCVRYIVGGKMNDKNQGQRINMEICLKFGKSASETLAILVMTYGENAMKIMINFELRRWLKKEPNWKEDPRIEQPKTQRRCAKVGRV
jgi:hypothetical protein